MSTPFRLLLPAHILQSMIDQARAELPNECCGLLGGVLDPSGLVGHISRAFPLVNELASPVEFLSEPRSLFQAHRDMDRAGLALLAIYHSHPTSPPVPSKTDLQRNYSEEVMSLIVSMMEEPPRMRGWWLTSERFEEANIEITKEAP